MTGDAGLQGQLVGIFGAEASERVQAMNHHLLALEADLSGDELDEQLAGLFREAHSLKGAAGAVGMAEVEAIAHRLESVFQGVRSGAVRLLPAAFDVLYAGVDAIGTLVPAALDGRRAEVDVDATVVALERLAAPAAPHPASAAPHPAPGTPHPAPGTPEPGPRLLGPLNGRVAQRRVRGIRLSTAPRQLCPARRGRGRPGPRRPSGSPLPSSTR